METLIITPKTKIFDLLQVYPQLEEVLLSTTPQFKRLQNPMLRKTVTKITNISQAALIGGVSVENLVNTLRSKVGQSTYNSIDNRPNNYNFTMPEWFDSNNIVKTIDIREMLNNGEQPVHEILSVIGKLEPHKMLRVITPFLPVPLIDKSLSLEQKHWIDMKSNNDYHVYFAK